MILGIDASNIGSDGGIVHLSELLSHIDPNAYHIDKVIVWGGDALLSRLPKKDWLLLQAVAVLNQHVFYRNLWQRFKFPKLAERQCDVLFVPGGICYVRRLPCIVMSQNMLPFLWKEIFGYIKYFRFFRLLLLRYAQIRSFKKASGVIFLTDYSLDAVQKKAHITMNKSCVVPHGINPDFYIEPRYQKSIKNYNAESPFELLYVSTIDFYKQQEPVIEAVMALKKQGYPIVLRLVGSAYPPALKRLQKLLNKLDPEHKTVLYEEGECYPAIRAVYRRADMFIFASRCETFGNTLLEAAASGLPIVCLKGQPMQELLQNACEYFNVSSSDEIFCVVKKLLDDESLRYEYAQKAYQRAKNYSWNKTAEKTGAFINEVLR